ncbi:LacI family DNA-binding transcriptional regulator [Pseudozobellia thermophila]|uniref:LacI family DNA-binding transcriptional regulator n=1 Tax=Pseudozobellia thermophila TaxID=192903 RepID=UPI00093352DD|nr:LacI family DNA-binding transcriptional regulator [Pseudozobellia thermophila]
MKKKTTIYDLAKKLGVSPATISRSLNDHPSISIKTKEKVLQAAKETGYRINKFASNLSLQKSNTIGVIVPRLNSDFMSTVLSGIEKIANNAGYNLIISQSLEQEAKEKFNTKTLFESGVDALLVSLANETKNYEHFATFTERKIPLLFFDRVVDLPNCPTIIIDNEAAGYQATEHLIKQGCENIIHVSSGLNRSVYKLRYSGYKKALKEFSTYNREQLVEVGNFSQAEAQKVVDYIQSSKQPVDGVFVSNDNLAVYIIKALLKAGYKIPDQIKIIGFNNDPVTQVISPELSTIDYPGYKMGKLAGQSILSHLNGSINIESADQIILKHELIIRESSQK